MANDAIHSSALSKEPRAQDARPRLAFRVGVTGHRHLAADLPALRGQVAQAIDAIEAGITTNSESKIAKRLYADLAPLLQIVSPLAEGADRLAAHLAVARNWRLAALPFEQAEYKKDSPETAAEFRTLLAAAASGGQVMELDGQRHDEKSAYSEVGRFVLRGSDLVVAVWDGEPPKGEGGTGQIISEALGLGIPVLHINSISPHAVKLERVSKRIKDLREPLGSRSLQREILGAASMMRDDAADWSAIFEVKESETA